MIQTENSRWWPILYRSFSDLDVGQVESYTLLYFKKK